MSKRDAEPKRVDRQRPLYSRILRLDNLRPGGAMCFLLFEGSIAFAILFSLAELVSWWSVLVLPLVIAGFVKIDDVVVGIFGRSGRVHAGIRRLARIDTASGTMTQAVSVSAVRRDHMTYRGTAAVGLRPPGRPRATNQRRFAQAGGGRPTEPPKSRW